jgi:branched-chain amino acid transport system ATP-binding protein
MPEMLLEVADLDAGYGDALVLEGVSFSMAPGDTLALLGRNGMGKTTLLATLMGHTRVRGGSVRLLGRELLNLAPHARARAGLGWVAQERDIFPSLTVEENLTVAARRGRWDVQAVYGLFPRLKERRRNMGNHLSGGEQQMLALGRALMTNPSLLLLDEPMEGLAPVIVEEIQACIRRMVEEEGMAVILVEQHAHLALRLTRHAVVLERGMVAHAARSADLLADHATLDRLIGVRNGGHGRRGSAAEGVSAVA